MARSKLEHRRDNCRLKGDHTPGPDGYIARDNWFREMAKTHIQKRCRGCGLWMVWVRKTKHKRKYMKRKITVSAHTDHVRVSLTAVIQSTGVLTSKEIAHVRKELAERLMTTLPGLKYAPISLTEIKVT